jgi:methylmalonyl-CoA mutase N-terminal domain/subunit
VRLPCQLGYDSDDSRATGEVGACGVAINTLRDMECRNWISLEREF